MAKEKTNREDKLGFGKLLIWNSRMVATTINVLMMGYLSIYCTDTLKLSPAFVSILLVVSKLVDGVTDMAAGIIVDKTETKWGKARPYEIFIVGLWLCTWLLFSTPASASTLVKCIWVFIMYTLTNSICYTFLNANGTTYTVRAFNDKQIVKLTSYSSVITMLSAVAFNVVFPALMANIATSAAGWSRLVLMWAVPMVAIGVLRMIFVPEKYTVVDQSASGEKVKVKDILTVIKTNKYILLVALMTFVFNFVTNMGVNLYYWTYIVKNVGAMGITSLAQMVAIPLAFVFPALLKKMSLKKLMMIGFFVSAFGYFLNFVADVNVALLSVAAIFWGAGTIPASMLVMLLILECADFNEWKGIHRMEGTMSAINSLASKVGSAIGAAALGFLLTASHYTGEMETMPGSAFTMIRMLYTLVPTALYIFVALSLTFYNLDKIKPQMMIDLEEKRKAAAGIAENAES